MIKKKEEKKKKQQDSGALEKAKYMALWNMDLKQLDDHSSPESDKYTESSMKEDIFQKEKYSRVMWFRLIVWESFYSFIQVLGEQ